VIRATVRGETSKGQEGTTHRLTIVAEPACEEGPVQHQTSRGYHPD
jgi:hypothetical protein